MNNHLEEFIDDIEEIEDSYKAINNKAINKLSYWNASPLVAKSFLGKISFFDNLKTTNYIFSYELDKRIQEDLKEKFGCNKDLNDLVITPSGSLSIYNVINFLKQSKLKKIALLSPVYFTVPIVCDNLSVSYSTFFLEKNNAGDFTLNDDKINSDFDVIWITNPVYCTSTYYNEEFKKKIYNWIEQGKFIVFDEALSLYGRELIREFHMFENVISICSPHKSLCINGNKFSAIIIHKKFTNIFNAWLDIISGCLSLSNYRAIHHFLEESYINLQNDFSEITTKNFEIVASLCEEYNVEYDKKSIGCFMSVYFKDIEASKGNDREFLRDLFLFSGASFIPGSRNFFDPNLGFSFRLNLSRIDESSVRSLKKIFKKLKNHYVNESILVNS